MRIIIIVCSMLFAFSISSCAPRIDTRPTKVVYVKKAPIYHKVIKVKGKRYYYWNGKHYKKTRRGYVVVRI